MSKNENKPKLHDVCEALAAEGRLQEKYSQIGHSVKSAQARKEMEKLVELSVEKMKILYKIVCNTPWELKK
ncbi:MAG: hypothetical protein WC457_03070 [Patescibacteria group bacterium]